MADLKKYQMYIDGQWVNSESEKTFESLILPQKNLGRSFRRLEPMMWIVRLKQRTVLLLRGHGQT